MLALAAIAMISPIQDGCVPLDAPWSADEVGPPLQKSGDGLWIGGMSFGIADVASAAAQQDALTGQWMLEIHFTQAGNTKFIAAQRCGIGRPIEVSIDGAVLSRPMLQERIMGGKANITGNFTRVDAARLAARIAPPPPDPSSIPTPR